MRVEVEASAIEFATFNSSCHVLPVLFFAAIVVASCRQGHMQRIRGGGGGTGGRDATSSSDGGSSRGDDSSFSGGGGDSGGGGASGDW